MDIVFFFFFFFLHPTSLHMEAAKTKASLSTLKIFRSKKQGKLQRLLDPRQITPDNLKNNRRETSRYVGKTKRNILKIKIVTLKQTVRTRV